jgi:glycosyltransferase involved in cell wall biosynthesis
MKILLVHNAYQHPGGEDNVFNAERDLLAAAGHSVTTYLRHNDDISADGFFSSAKLATQTIWSQDSYRALGGLLRESRPDIVHFHNTFPLISPAAYYACAKAGVPMVQTLHNYRLVCPGSMLLRDGIVCEKCLGRSIPWPGIAHACYRGSRAVTSAVATMLTVHNVLGTWQHRVNAYIALTEFARRKFVEAGFCHERIVVKPNFVSLDPGRPVKKGDYALFVGRLSEEKGLRVLLHSWSELSNVIPLKIAGDGPLRDEMENLAQRTGLKSVSFLGRLRSSDTVNLMRGARFLVFPSLWFEGFPLTIAEAFACGAPVIASNLGAMCEIVEDGKTGLHFKVGDSVDLASKVEWAWIHPGDLEVMGRAAQAEYEAKYTPKRNYQMLIEIYQSVIRQRAGAHGN